MKGGQSLGSSKGGLTLTTNSSGPRTDKSSIKKISPLSATKPVQRAGKNVPFPDLLILLSLVMAQGTVPGRKSPLDASGS